jgi:hypothetical protein
LVAPVRPETDFDLLIGDLKERHQEPCLVGVAGRFSPIEFDQLGRCWFHQVVDLFIRINRDLAPPDMREQFEQYIQTSIDGQMRRLGDIVWCNAF